MRKLIFAVALAVVTAVAAFGAAKNQMVTVSAKPGDDLNAKLEELRASLNVDTEEEIINSIKEIKNLLAERNRICTVELSDFSHASSPSGYFLIPNSRPFHFSLTTIKCLVREP